MALKARRSKFNAKRTTVDGITFDSQKEANRYRELSLLLRAGKIRHLVLQPSMALYAAEFRDLQFTNRQHEVGSYRADFAYQEIASGEIVYEDVKGFKTPLYRWKKRHVEAQYGITIREV